MGFFLAGLITGGAVFFGLYLNARRERERALAARQHVFQEKEIVVEFMHDMVEALGEGLSRQELFQRIVHAAILSTGALSACVFEKTDGDRLQGVAVEGLFPPHRPLPASSKVKLMTRARFIEQILRSESFEIGEGFIGGVARTRKAELIENGIGHRRLTQHDDPALAIRSIIAAPILFGDRLIGVLAVANPVTGQSFTSTDFSLVESLAEQAGLTVHNNEFLSMQIEKQQLDLDLSLARDIQRLLVPQEVPRMPGLDLDARYIPAQQVGGDLVDLFPLEGGRLGVAVADVSGKGVPASILMAICRTHLRNFAEIHRSPSAVLRETNRAMIGEMRQEMYITIVFGVVDPRQNTIVFARAGHELPLVAYPDDSGQFTTEYLGSEGMPVGMVEPELFDLVLEDRTVVTRPGDLFVLYTDGVTEAPNPEGKEFSGARLADAVKTLRARSAPDLISGILENVARFSGRTDYPDDISLIAIKRTNG
jgi:sigma-B regulation protein RsbU (phosphoserine phosphatase)